jgi:hypothetical protein
MRRFVDKPPPSDLTTWRSAPRRRNGPTAEDTVRAARALLQSRDPHDKAMAEELALGLVQRYARKIHTYVQGLSFDRTLQDDTYQSIINDILWRILTPTQEFWGKNFFWSLDKYCRSQFTKALRSAGKGSPRDEQGRSRGKRVPADLVLSLGAPPGGGEEERDLRELIAHPHDDVRAADSSMETDRWLESIPDETDRRVAWLALVAQLDWDDIVKYLRDHYTDLMTPAARTAAQADARARYELARQHLQAFLRAEGHPSAVAYDERREAARQRREEAATRAEEPTPKRADGRRLATGTHAGTLPGTQAGRPIGAPPGTKAGPKAGTKESDMAPPREPQETITERIIRLHTQHPEWQWKQVSAVAGLVGDSDGENARNRYGRHERKKREQQAQAARLAATAQPQAILPAAPGGAGALPSAGDLSRVSAARTPSESEPSVTTEPPTRDAPAPLTRAPAVERPIERSIGAPALSPVAVAALESFDALTDALWSQWASAAARAAWLERVETWRRGVVGLARSLPIAPGGRSTLPAETTTRRRAPSPLLAAPFDRQRMVGTILRALGRAHFHCLPTVRQGWGSAEALAEWIAQFDDLANSMRAAATLAPVVTPAPAERENMLNNMRKNVEVGG